jgi:hypothetical protein
MAMSQLALTLEESMKPAANLFLRRSGDRNVWRWSLLPIFAVLCLALSQQVAQGQLETGSIQGKIADPSGAALSRAAVHVVNKATGLAKDVVTNNAGLYSVQGLYPGDYTVTITATGFQTLQQHITLLAEQTFELSPSLIVGSASETVEVHADAIQLANYTNGTISSDLDETRISQIPENGRSVTNLFSQVTPDAMADGGRPELNGALWRATQLVQDGSINNDLNYGGTLIPQPDLDSMKEVSVVTNGGDARYNAPATAVVTTKSGTNQLHGSFFETAVNSYFGIARSRANLPTFKQAHYVRNEFGASVGGPILIPWLDHGKMYNGKDKSFFFVAYERYSLRSGNYQSGVVPTTAERGGDFSGATTAGGVALSLYDPATTSSIATSTCAGSPASTSYQYCRSQFNYNGKANTIDPSRISPFAKALYTIMPRPTNDANPYLTGSPNIYFAAPNNTTTPTITARLDHTFDQNNNIYLRYSYINYSVVSTPVSGVAPTVAGSAVDGTPIPAEVSNTTGTRQPVNTAALGYTHVFSPTFVSQTVLGGTWESEFYNEPPTGELTDYEQAMGLPNNFGLHGMPIMEGSSLYNLAYTQNNWGGGEVLLNINEDLTKTIGHHNLAFGGRYGYAQANVLPDRTSDYVAFDNQATALYNSGAACCTAVSNTGVGDADVFLGAADAYSVNLEPGNEHWRIQSPALYVQDSWRVDNKLTLDLGLRWEGDPSPKELEGIINGFDLNNKAIVMHNTPQQVIAMGRTTQGIITNLQNLGVNFETPSQAGFPSYITHGSWDVFAPRVGLAFAPFGSGKGTVFRGSFGRYAFQAQLRPLYSGGKSNAPYAENYAQSYISNQQSPDGKANYELRAPQTVVAGQNSSGVVNTSSTTAILPGVTQVVQGPNDPPNSMYQTNATVEQPLWYNSVLRVSYIFNHADNLDQIYEPNFPMSSYAYEAKTGITAPVGYSALYPYDSHTYGIIEYFEPTGWSNYNELQVNYQRLFHRGYGFQVAYVWRKSLRVGENGVNDTIDYTTQDYAPGFAPASQQAANRAQNYEVWSAVSPQQITYNSVVDLPIGRDRKFGRHMNHVLDEFVGGYQVAFNGSAAPSWFQPVSTNWGGDNPAGTGSMAPIKKYGHKYPIQSCSGTTCNRGYLYYNAFISPVLTTNPCGSTSFISGVPNYQANQTPINMDPGATTAANCKNGTFTPTNSNYLTNNVSVPLTGGGVGNVAYSPGPGINPFSKTFLVGPWNATTDISLFKVFPLHKSMFFRINVDAFNAFNQQGQTNPGTNGVQLYTSSHNTPRQIQLTARLTF